MYKCLLKLCHVTDYYIASSDVSDGVICLP